MRNSAVLSEQVGLIFVLFVSWISAGVICYVLHRDWHPAYIPALIAVLSFMIILATLTASVVVMLHRDSAHSDEG